MRHLKSLATGLLISVSMSAVAQADTIRFWTTEEQPARLARQEAMAADFEKRTGHVVEVIPVTESDLGTRATAAVEAAPRRRKLAAVPAAVEPFTTLTK